MNFIHSSDIRWIPKNWGGEKIIVNNDKYCGKILFFIKGKRASFHYHKKKEESFYVQSGAIKLYSSSLLPEDLEVNIKHGIALDEFCNVDVLERGDVFHLEPYTAHQIVALEDSEIFEFSTTDFPEDSYRLIKGD